MRSIFIVIALIWVVFSCSIARAQALRFQPQGAAAAGQGNAFAAQADDASAIQYNPAALSQLQGIQIYAGAVAMGGSIKYQSPAGVGTTGDFGGAVVYPPPSHFYVSANLGAVGLPGLSSMTLGLGVNSPFGLNTRYPADGPFNTAAIAATLPLIDIKPTIAYKVNNDLSIGIGADIYTFAGFLGEGQAEQKQAWPGGLGIPVGTPVELYGNGTTAGFSVSLLYSPLKNDDGKPIASIGLVYHSQALLPLHGALLVNGAKVADASTSLPLPPIYTGAMAIWPVRTREREWKLEIDVEFVGWHYYKNLDIHLSNGVTISQPRQWSTVPVIAVGTEYKWIEPAWLPSWDVAVRAGYTRTEDPVPDQTFNPNTVSLTANTLSLGAGFLCRGPGRFLGIVPCGGKSALWPKGIGLDTAFQDWFYEPRSITGNVNPTVNGNYRASVYLGIASLKLLY